MSFYVILGVSADASAAQIKRAYQRLARRHHPGINPGDRAAEALFARIAEAYDTLTDPRRREEYDRSGGRPAPAVVATPQFTEFNFSARALGDQASTFTELFAEVLHPTPGAAGRPEAGADLHTTLGIPFAVALAGDERQVVVTRQVPCGACGGAGRRAASEGRCGRCEGRGKTRWARGHMVLSKDCQSCGGSGQRAPEPCRGCAGQGVVTRGEQIAVHVPAGVPQGARLRVPEGGHAGRHGGRTGDLYVTIEVEPHPLFRREGQDLLCTVPVAVHEAVLGARIEVPLLEGRVRVPIPPGTQGGRRIRVTGRGVPTPSGGAGDLIVEVRIVLPVTVDERSRELIREFGHRNQEDVRKTLSTGSDPVGQQAAASAAQRDV